MLRCSKNAYSQCPDHHLCGSIEEATFTEDSECDKFNRAVEEKSMTNADRILDMSEWISVKDRLPEFETPVLISLQMQNDIFARVGWLHKNGMWSVPTTKKWLSDRVTHWMPLPEPPKETQP